MSRSCSFIRTCGIVAACWREDGPPRNIAGVMGRWDARRRATGADVGVRAEHVRPTPVAAHAFRGAVRLRVPRHTQGSAVDTGTGNAGLREAVDELLRERDLELLVAHTHGHGDHVGGDAELLSRPRTTEVPMGTLESIE